MLVISNTKTLLIKSIDAIISTHREIAYLTLIKEEKAREKLWRVRGMIPY